MPDMAVLEAMKRKAESLRQESERAKGALEVGLKRLKAEYDCPTLEAAQKKLDKLVAQEEKLSGELEAAVEDFRTKWKDVLGEE